MFIVILIGMVIMISVITTIVYLKRKDKQMLYTGQIIPHQSDTSTLAKGTYENHIEDYQKRVDQYNIIPVNSFIE